MLPCLLGLCVTAMAEVPQSGLLQRVALESGRTLSWMLQGSSALGWRLTVSDADQLLVDADLGNCSFCAGEEDNCAANGIFLREIAGIESPLAIAVCHVGAHSQRLQLFDPAVSASNPALQLTGSYFVDWSVDERQRLRLEWDGDDNSIPGCSIDIDSSLAMAPPQNHLLVASPCYRTGSATD